MPAAGQGRRVGGRGRRVIRAACVALGMLTLAGCPGDPDPNEAPQRAAERVTRVDARRPLIEPTRPDAAPRPPDAAPDPTPDAGLAVVPDAAPTAVDPPDAAPPEAAPEDAPAGDQPRGAMPVVEELTGVPPVRAPDPVRTIVRLDRLPSTGAGHSGLGPSGTPGTTPTRRPDLPTAEGPVPDALGTSGSRVLFSFRADPARGLAAHDYACRPEVILEALRDTINRSRGDDEPCAADLQSHGGSRMLRVTCEQPDGADRLVYFGTVWVQGAPSSLLDYEVHAFGRALRRRGRRLEAVGARLHRWPSRQGRAIRALFDTCGQRPTSEAGSSSPSSSDGAPGR